ncbi:MAG: hypothetical protein KAS73_14825 [Candidatus Sabulitectum sp.]|nr:hypothetical protein [Candidatus Sabulitectum sp.]
MKIRSAVVSFSEQEINTILANLDLPAEVKVSCQDGRLVVRIRKGITVKLNTIFSADGRHLSATIDMGFPGNPIVSRILKRAVANDSEWGIYLTNRTISFDPQVAMMNSGIEGDFRVEKTAVGAGELVFAVDGEIPLDQFMKKTGNPAD